MGNKEAEATADNGWVSLAVFGEHLGGVGRTWLYDRMKDGMPYAIIAGRRKVKISDAATWLEKEGHLRRSED